MAYSLSPVCYLTVHVNCIILETHKVSKELIAKQSKFSGVGPYYHSFRLQCPRVSVGRGQYDNSAVRITEHSSIAERRLPVPFLATPVLQRYIAQKNTWLLANVRAANINPRATRSAVKRSTYRLSTIQACIIALFLPRTPLHHCYRTLLEATFRSGWQ